MSNAAKEQISYTFMRQDLRQHPQEPLKEDLGGLRGLNYCKVQRLTTENVRNQPSQGEGLLSELSF